MTEATTMPEKPVLIINPHNGGGKAEQFGFVEAARAVGIDTVVLKPDDDLAALARDAADRVTNHLMMTGGDGSRAVVAAVAAAGNVTFGCVPAGTRNHSALDIGPDRESPLSAPQSVVEPARLVVDVAQIDGRLILNNVSFGVYATATGDSEYRDH